MWVVVAHDITDDTGGLRKVAIGAVAAVVHCVQDAAMYGLETIAHIGERTRNNDTHGVVEIGPRHFHLQVDRLDTATHGHFFDHIVISHGDPLNIQEANVAGIALNKVAA